MDGPSEYFRAIPCGRRGFTAVDARSSHAFPAHFHDEYGVGMVRSGAQKSRSGRGPVEAAEGDMITVNPGEVHDGAPISNGGRAWTMLYIDPRVVREAVRDVRDGGDRTFEFTLPRLRDDRIAGHFRALFAAVTGNLADWDAEEWLLRLLGDLVRPHEKIATAFCPRAVGRGLALIDADPAAPLSLARIAREAGLSRYQVLRGFKRATGVTPHAYLVQRRLQTARRLIAGRTPLAGAAAAAGFADQSHMTRLFVRTYGISPGAFAVATR